MGPTRPSCCRDSDPCFRTEFLLNGGSPGDPDDWFGRWTVPRGELWRSAPGVLIDFGTSWKGLPRLGAFTIKVTHMATNQVFRSVLLASGALLLAACATQPDRAPGSLEERYFLREANHYQKFTHEGQTIYCQNQPRAASLIPDKWCMTEEALRIRVENARRDRNPVMPALVQRG